MLKLIYFFFISFLFISCSEELTLEDIVSKTWDLKWKKCGLYQSSIDAKINFNTTDTINDGWYLENSDTSFFQFQIIDNRTILLDSASNIDWSGVLKVSNYSSNHLELERSNKSCENEIYSFK